VAAFQVSEDNYKKALEHLKKRYDKKVLILLEHVSSFFSISQIRKSYSSSLREILDTVAALRGSLALLAPNKMHLKPFYFSSFCKRSIQIQKMLMIEVRTMSSFQLGIISTTY